MFKKIEFKSLNYQELNKLDHHDIKRENLQSFYQTFDFINLIERWPLIIGAQLAKVTSPLKIKNGSLIIVATHSSYSQNISFLSEEIKMKIFSEFPELKKIINKLQFMTQENFFKQNPQLIASAASNNRLHPHDPRIKIKKAQAEILFANIDDMELKKTLTSIFIQMD